MCTYTKYLTITWIYRHLYVSFNFVQKSPITIQFSSKIKNKTYPAPEKQTPPPPKKATIKSPPCGYTCDKLGMFSLLRLYLKGDKRKKKINKTKIIMIIIKITNDKEGNKKKETKKKDPVGFELMIFRFRAL